LDFIAPEKRGYNYIKRAALGAKPFAVPRAVFLFFGRI
jgi:hypothetical protein